MTGPIRPIRIEGDLAYVPLTKGYEAIIDAVDVPLIDGWNWHALVRRRRDGSIRTVYAARMDPRDGGKQRHVRMHRVILGLSHVDPAEGDHKDGDGLNNCRFNLRISTTAENRRNKRSQVNNTSGFKGVTFRMSNGKFSARITVNGERIHLGCFLTATAAHDAYATASATLHGEFGRTV
ncbi:MAG: hypothetical protein ACRC14_18925 [Paracoccaceae bacterium]